MEDTKYVALNITDQLDGVKVLDVINFLSMFLKEQPKAENATMCLTAADYIPEATIQYHRAKTAEDYVEEKATRRAWAEKELARAEKQYLRLKAKVEDCKSPLIPK